ncbi:cyclin-K [Trichechus manatus latirostris]|uniref:Cyclin-K n=1 Tax=Trichechus manatus latirostris TaxID=127582 RepID=A0A2Y9QVQ8_TRIMA|nr:cyclin-K [Trichechus manatus latirostris]
MFHSFKQFPRYVTGACCLFLAGKVEETPKKCKDIIKTARSLLNDVQFGQFGDDPKEEVMVLERILLQTIKFDLQVEHPYQFLLKYAKQLKGDKNKIQKLVQMAWTFVNDSLCTTLSLQWEPEIIAVAVMYLAGRLCKFEIQEWTSKPMYRRWWEQFVQDVPVDVLEDICHQILDLYSQGKQQMPHHTPHQLQQPPSLQSTPQVPQVQQPPPPQGSEPPQPPQKDCPQPAQQQQQAQQPKKPSPQPSPPRQVKRAVVVSPKEESKAPEPPPSKIPKLETTTHPPLPPAHPPPDRKPPLAAALGEAEPPGPVDAGDLPKVQIPPPAHPAPVHQPPPLPHRPPPPPPSSYITGMSTTSSYMSGEGYQSLQSMMKTEGPAYGALPPAYGPPAHLPYHPHVYPPNPGRVDSGRQCGQEREVNWGCSRLHGADWLERSCAGPLAAPDPRRREAALGDLVLASVLTSHIGSDHGCGRPLSCENQCLFFLETQFSTVRLRLESHCLQRFRSAASSPTTPVGRRSRVFDFQFF